MSAAHVGPELRRIDRFAPAGGLGFLLSIAVGALVLGDAPPSSQASTEEIATYFADHRSGVLFNSSIVAFGAFALYPWFLASLWRAIREAEGEDGILAIVAFVGGLSLLGPLLLQAAGWGAAALEAGPRRDPSIATGLMDLGNMGFLLAPMPSALLVGATTLASRRSVLLPVWLTWAGVPLVAVLVAGGLVGFAPQLLFALVSLWLFAVVVVLFRRSAPGSGPR